ncbi:class I SAM-dependent methyltransferase [Cellulosimicrobium sp. XJ-DQ-B-000]|uniref:class I SAM-dependent methyltransferase n=1 Tax=Cellulosimicrobium sp. XJ-DQ-B-000 TaxID=3072182 RepID=UPI0028068042|nr:class I SAM-dependent methyltransferase [Cellulosimicrobium sp. XJ-DQ-B-000]MDQ8042379.1 class I SAM-dependent methyltransferase [Cellulosimicrobium sp. XJ-DQ-B-000]
MTTSPDLAALLERLRTHDVGPDREDAPVAVDPADRLLLDEAAPLLAGVAPGAVAVVDDRYGALTLGAALLTGAGPAGGRVRVHQDACTGEAALDANARAAGMTTAYDRHGLDAGLLAGARVVLLRLPRGLAALRDVAEHAAREAGPDVVLLGSARVKHMTRAMNDVLAESFGEVRASLARGRSRVLVASAPRPARPLTYPVVTDLADVGLRVAAFGAAFAGAGLDLGTRFLLDRLGADDGPTPGGQGAAPRDVVDLGCGTGLLAAWAARRWPDARVVAADRSDAAVRSTALTARENGVADRVRTVRDDAGATLADASADVVLLNPPFHDGAAVRTDAAHRMFATAGRVLRPGGELWCVWNSHLRYRPALERAVGPTTQVARDPRFTVTRSVRR